MRWPSFESFFSRRARSRRSAGMRPPRDNRFRPSLESLEDRLTPTVGIRLDPVSGLSGLTSPLLVTNAHDSTGRLFVVEQAGRILVRQPDGAVGVFLDISAGATDPADRRVNLGAEQGLLGLAFSPHFATDGLFYLHYTRAGLTNTNDIVEYHVDPANPNVADPTSERLLLRIPQPFLNHNGGMIAFGPDGMLYIGKGDGGGGNDPNDNAQNLGVLLGKILRIDVTRDDFPADANRNYGIPADNPFVGTSGAAPEVYALGLRNPFRFSFDDATGQLYVGDVGQSHREEIDIVTKGGNYGWRAFEGTIPTPSDTGSPLYPDEVAALQNVAIPPITDLDRSLAQAITGGFVYRGTQGTLPLGAYLFGDFNSGRVFLYDNGTRETLIDNTGLTISSFGEDEAGEIYAVGYGDGKVYKVDATTGVATAGVANGVLTYTAAAGQANNVTVTTDGTNLILTDTSAVIRAPGAQGDGTQRVMFPLAGVTRIVIDLGDKDDIAHVNIGIGTVVTGGDGNDSIVGGGGNDTLVGGAGDDTLIGGAGDDQLFGGDGNDLLSGEAGDDSMDGNAGNDLLFGGDGADLMFGSAGDDSMDGQAGNDALDGGDGNDLMFGSAGDDVLFGGIGNDSLDGGAGNDLLFGGDGDDLLFGGVGNDSIDAGQGNDSVDGNDGDDLVFGGEGNDLIFGGNGNDSIDAGGGTDSVDAGLGIDMIYNAETAYDR